MICKYKQCNKSTSTDTVCQCERNVLKEQESLRCETEGLRYDNKVLWTEIESLKEQVKALQDINKFKSSPLNQPRATEFGEPKQSAEDKLERIREVMDAIGHRRFSYRSAGREVIEILDED